jgi:hypothetical protein
MISAKLQLVGVTIQCLMVGLLSLAPIAVHSGSLKPSAQNKPSVIVPGPAPRLDEVLGWLPADTETLMVANGPFRVPVQSRANQDARQEKAWQAATTPQQVRDEMQITAISLLNAGKSGILRAMGGRNVKLAVEGSRRFRAPRDLGSMTFEGCAIVILEDQPKGFDLNAAMIAAKKHAKATKVIEGMKVLVFQELFEKDVWTTFVVNPRPNVILAASNESYITEVLKRLNGNLGARALPDELPEWKYVDRKLAFWGLRHFDRSQAALDPSSPFGGRKSANFPDEQAIGLVLVLAPEVGEGSIIQLSKPGLNKMTGLQAGIHEDPANVELKTVTIAPGVVESKFKLDTGARLSFFGLIAGTALGHGLYL